MFLGSLDLSFHLLRLLSTILVVLYKQCNFCLTELVGTEHTEILKHLNKMEFKKRLFLCIINQTYNKLEKEAKKVAIRDHSQVEFVVFYKDCF